MNQITNRERTTFLSVCLSDSAPYKRHILGRSARLVCRRQQFIETNKECYDTTADWLVAGTSSEGDGTRGSTMAVVRNWVPDLIDH